MRIFTLLAALLAAAAFTGCADDGDDAADDTTGPAAGPAISIDDALAADSDEPLLVAGNLLVLGDDVRLCSALAESFPPQCGGASLHVDGLDLAEVDGLITEGDVSWTDRPVELLGVVEDETLTVSENVL
jgi:hypothetical protein